MREIHRLGREAPAATFQDDAFEAMKGLIRFDYGYWGAVRGPAESVVMHYSFLHRLSAAEMIAAFEKVKSHPKMVELVDCQLTNAGRAVSCDLKEACIDFHVDVDQVISIYQRDADLGIYNVISLYRSGGERFTEQECLLFESSVSHLWDAWRENKLLQMSGGAGQGCSLTPAAALLDNEGVVHFARPAFVELMRREWPDWHGPFVPEAMRRMREGAFLGEEVAVRFVPQHDLILTVLRERGPLDSLTEREMEVVELLANGACHKEIARHLGIAPTTARNHIARIYDKLGSSKATQVAAMLMKKGML